MILAATPNSCPELMSEVPVPSHLPGILISVGREHRCFRLSRAEYFIVCRCDRRFRVAECFSSTFCYHPSPSVCAYAWTGTFRTDFSEKSFISLAFGATRRDRTGDLLITKFRVAVYAIDSGFGVRPCTSAISA